MVMMTSIRSIRVQCSQNIIVLGASTQLNCCFCRSSSTATKISSAATQPMSKRKRFRSIAPEYLIVDKLDKLKLGYCSKRRHRVAVARKFGNLKYRPPVVEKITLPILLKEQRKVSPYPFKKLGVSLLQAARLRDLPPGFAGNDPPPEVAVIGRSNVGKSTLLNALLSFDLSYVQKAKVSPKPGETRMLQCYGLGRHPLKETAANAAVEVGKARLRDVTATSSGNTGRLSRRAPPKPEKREGSAMVLVDMPGYGFAHMADAEHKRVQSLISQYLRERGPALKRVLLLLDARHGFKVGDRIFFQKLIDGTLDVDEENGECSREGSVGDFDHKQSKTRKLTWKLQIVVTKCDLVDRMELARRLRIVEDTAQDMLGFGSMLPLMAVSGKDGAGLVELKRELASMVVAPPQWDTSNLALAAAASAKNASTKDPAESALTTPVSHAPKVYKSSVKSQFSDNSDCTPIMAGDEETSNPARSVSWSFGDGTRRGKVWSKRSFWDGTSRSAKAKSRLSRPRDGESDVGRNTYVSSDSNSDMLRDQRVTRDRESGRRQDQRVSRDSEGGKGRDRSVSRESKIDKGRNQRISRDSEGDTWRGRKVKTIKRDDKKRDQSRSASRGGSRLKDHKFKPRWRDIGKTNTSKRSRSLTKS